MTSRKTPDYDSFPPGTPIDGAGSGPADGDGGPGAISDLKALRRIQQITARLGGSRDLHARLAEVLAAAADMLGAGKGTIEVYDPDSGARTMVAHQGFGDRFLQQFRSLKSVALADFAPGRLERRIWEDLASDPDLAEAEELRAALGDGIRAMITTPIMGLDGRLLGLLSTYFRAIYRPDIRDLQYLDLLARMAGDFIERWHGEEALERTNLLLASALEAGRAGAFEWDIVRNINRWSPELERLYGLKPGSFPGTLEAWAELVHPDDLRKTMPIVHQALETGELSAEWRVLRPGGEVRWLRATGKVIYDEQRHPVRMNGINVDITEQKRAERALGESEERFRALTMASSDVVYRMSADWTEMRFLDGREFIADTLEPSGTWIEKYIFPDDREFVLTAIRRAVHTKSVFELEHRVIRVDGSFGWTTSRAVPILDDDGRIVEWFGAARDITERKRSQEALAASVERYRSLAEQVSEGIFIANAQGRYMDANAAACEMLGYTREELLSIELADAIAPDERERFPQQLEQLASGRPVRSDWRFLRKDGSTFIGELDGRQLPDGGYQGVVRDVTQRRRAEEDLRHANRDLEQLAYSASHDLQEPLRNVKIFSDLLMQRYGGQLQGEAREFLGTVSSGAARMEAMLRDLLGYAQTLTLGAPAEAVESEGPLREALSNLAGAIAQSEASIESGRMPALRVHATHMQQLFQNLIGNALKYRKPGVPPEIRVDAVRERGSWLFSVQDNGIGIEPEYKELIFGLFRRLHTGEEYSGTGIGLALCQRIVDRYHGTIWVESESGKGSTFFFRLAA